MTNDHDDVSLMRPFDFKRALRSSVVERYRSGDFTRPGDVRALRRFIHMTQRQMAVALCIPLNRLQRWERGVIPVDDCGSRVLALAARHPGMAHRHQISYDARLIAHPDW